jgi:hypothetical protein
MEFADRTMPPLPFHVSPSAVPDLDAGDADMTRAMVERIIQLGPKSGAEALRQLRAAFPDAPLALRVAALTMLMRRNGQGPRAA